MELESEVEHDAEVGRGAGKDLVYVSHLGWIA